MSPRSTGDVYIFALLNAVANGTDTELTKKQFLLSVLLTLSYFPSLLLVFIL